MTESPAHRLIPSSEDRVNVAVTDRAAAIVTVHAPVPVHAPFQPVNVELAFGATVRVTTVPESYKLLHVISQVIPAGSKVTTPLPLPAFTTLKVYWILANVAVTEATAFIVTVHVPVPVQAPLQPVKVDVASDVAARVTRVPVSNNALQIVPQVIPAVDEVTVPPPVPVIVTLKGYWLVANVAVTALAASMVTVQLSVPVHAPLQPVNVEVGLGVTITLRVTMVPASNKALHVVPQIIPAGEEVTAPPPRPFSVTVKLYWIRVNVAVTAWTALIVTVHVPVPVQAPLQPVKVELASGIAVSVTPIPAVNNALHVAPQVIPAGEDVTVPPPVPPLVTLTLYWIRVKVAVTVWAALIVTLQLPVPLHTPFQPPKVEAPSDATLRVTTVPLSNDALQVDPQVIPAGEEVTIPPPVPLSVTVKLYWILVNVAVTEAGAFIATLQLPIPVHAPLQPVKVELASGVAVRVTPVPAVNSALQVVPQVIPAGEEVTIPPPVPVFVALKLYWIRVKVAVTVWAVLIVTVHVPVPVQAPPQPPKVEVPSDATLRVTTVPLSNDALQVAPQVIPAGEEVTAPPSVPVSVIVKLYWILAKVAVTAWAAVIVTLQLPVPVHAPLQPVKVELASGVAMRVTTVPVSNDALQVDPQAIPVGEEAMVPPPVPALPTVRAYWILVNVAVTDAAALIITVQFPVPVHAPLQPVKVELASGIAVRVTTVPAVNSALQVVPQVIPVGEEVTVPPPVPVLVTLKLYWILVNVAVTEAAALIVTLQLPVPVHAPLQPVKVDAPSGEAVSVTTVPDANDALQVVPQVMPAGEEVTVPPPVPAFVTLRVYRILVNFAVTVAAAFIVTVHVPVPVHAPLQPVKVDAPAGEAVSVTTVPDTNTALQVAPQVIPAGDEVTVPPPVPALVTLRV
jgi:hypothetical protein